MQLGKSGPDPRRAESLSGALRASTTTRGHRPAITVLGAGPNADRRDEQAYASLMQWVSKGAHLLEVDAEVQPGSLIAIDAPAGWLPASICLAAWWLGAVVTDDPTGADVLIAHADSPHAAQADWLVGDAVDGTPLGDTAVDAWSLAVQSFPDHPPPARGTGASLALRRATTTWTQTQLMEMAKGLPAGRLGMRMPLTLANWAVQLAARPAATGDPVVLVVAASEGDEEAERIAGWA